MKTIPVESTTLRTVGYDADRQVLQLEFHTRTVYQYFNVPADIHEGLLRAPSKGSYFNRFIRQEFPFVLVRTATSS